MEVEESKPEIYDETTPLTGNNDNSDEEDHGVAGCGCFRWRRRIMRWRKTAATSGSTTLQDHDQEEEAKRGRRSCLIWLKAKAKKMKQLSSGIVAAGPNFIRRNTNHNNKKMKKKKTTTSSNFQYDPRSYALNFDDGIDKEEDNHHFNFSGRYVLPPLNPS